MHPQVQTLRGLSIRTATALGFTQKCKPQLIMNTSPQTPSVEPKWAAFIGLDWGDSQHAIALEPTGQAVELSDLKHSAEGVQTWLDELEKRFGGAPVAVAIEATRGAMVYCLLGRPWITVYPIHPATSTRQRTAFRPSGGKDDTLDSRVLLETLTRHRDRLRPLDPVDDATRALAELTALRRKIVNQRTYVSNQLTAALKDTYPQALEGTGKELWSPMAVDFLEKWPTFTAIKAAKPAAVRRFYHAHNVRSEEVIEERLKAIAAARHITGDAAILLAREMAVAVAVAQLRVLQTHIAEIEAEIERRYVAHPEHQLFRNLPGAGPVMGPRLVAAFGTDRSRLDSPEAAQKIFGVAPVIQSSGKSRKVHRRWSANRFLLQSILEWCHQTIRYCPWSKAFYEQEKRRGIGHWTILRALAFKWIRILWKCWRTRTNYDGELYLRRLELRESSIAKRAREIATEFAATT
jgi:transposase